MGETANPNPLLFTEPTHYTPVYNTLAGDGSIGGAGALSDGVWWIERNVLYCLVSWVFGAAPAVGTGEVALPLPEPYALDLAAMPARAPSTTIFPATALVSKGGIDALAPIAAIVVNVPPPLLAAGGLLATLAGAVAGDAIFLTFSLPIKTVLPNG